MKCKCKCASTLKIPFGNPFRLCICRNKVAPGNPEDVTFADIDNLQVWFTRIIENIQTEHEVMDNGDLMILGDATLPATVYGIMMTGTYNGYPWRWSARRVFSIVSCNEDISDRDDESFGPDTYWLGDILEVDTDGDTMIFTTHGHATIVGGALTVQETANTKVDLDGDTIIFTQKSK